MGRRDQQAAQTRREIVAAARRLFAADGYARTSVARIAREAGVSVQTIYDAVGSKADLVAALNDLVDEEAGIAELAASLPSPADPEDLLALSVRITRQLVERCGDLVRASAAAADNEPQLRRVDDEGRRRHLHGSAQVAARLAALDALSVPEEQAAEVLAVLTDSRTALLCIDGYGWQPAQWERWTLASLAQLLLRS